MRKNRVVLISNLAGMVTFAPVLFYVLAFSTQPHHVAKAILTTFVGIALSGGSTWWIYRVGRIRAGRLSDPDPEGQTF